MRKPGTTMLIKSSSFVNADATACGKDFTYQKTTKLSLQQWPVKLLISSLCLPCRIALHRSYNLLLVASPGSVQNYHSKKSGHTVYYPEGSDSQITSMFNKVLIYNNNNYTPCCIHKERSQPDRHGIGYDFCVLV